MLQAAYQLRVALRDLKPAIYRDLLVDPGITLRKLHSVIQAAMGWDDEHLYGFALPTSSTQRYWRVPAQRRFEPKSASGGWGEPSPSDAKYRVQDVLTAPKQKLLYLYDFGDDWEHTVTLTAVGQAEGPLPRLLKAQNGCPPENCGGPPGAAYWASVWYDQQHPEHATAVDILGEHEPDWLDFERLQRAVSKLAPKPRTPKKQ